MRLYEIEVETPRGGKARKYHKSNLVARFNFEQLALNDNTLRLYRVCFVATASEVLENWANNEDFREQKTSRELLATRYPDAPKATRP